MKDKDLIEKWLAKAPAYEPVDLVRGLLVRAFGEDALCKGTRDSHQLRVKHPTLAEISGFGPFGFLSVPVSGGQRVKGRYLKQIAHAISREV